MPEKTVTIGGIDVPMKANAATPRHYRNKFGSDLLAAMTMMRQGRAVPEAIENLAYIMAKQADQTITEDVTEWLDQFDGPMDIRNATPGILSLWGENIATTADPKKKSEIQSGS